MHAHINTGTHRLKQTGSKPLGGPGEGEEVYAVTACILGEARSSIVQTARHGRHVASSAPDVQEAASTVTRTRAARTGQAILGHRIIWCPGAESNKAILAASYRHI